MTQAARVTAFRHGANLTQEALAEKWGVSVRSINRWEHGEGRPAEWMQREIAAAENPLHWPTAAMLKDLIENRPGPAMIYDPGMQVLSCSRMHSAWMHNVYGIDAVGVNWHRYMAESCMEMMERGGGMKSMVRHGLKNIRGVYQDPGGQSDTFIPPELFVDLTIVRIPDYGALCVCVSREPKPDEKLTPFQPYFLD
jgi:DNA-binding XRE family transcriptional regulator